MNTTLRGKNLALTDEIRQFVDEKMEDCYRALGGIERASVQVAIELERAPRRYLTEQEKGQAYRVEINVAVPRRVLRAEESADDLFKAIVEAKHTLTREIRKWRERQRDGRRNGSRQAKAMLNDEE